jgi:hypothetical protein
LLAEVVLDGRVVVCEVEDVVGSVVVELVHLRRRNAESGVLRLAAFNYFLSIISKKEIPALLKLQTNYIV